MKLNYLILFIFTNAFIISAQKKIDVFFDFNKYDINPIAKQYLSTWIENSTDIEVQKIYGYCDWIGSNTYNDSLSIKRVHAVYDFLKQHKVAIKTDYETKGFGEDFDQSSVQAENRKVSILYDKIAITKPKTEEAILLEELNLKIKTAKAGDNIRLKNIYFFNKSPRLLPVSKPVLYELLCVMNDNPKLKIEIQGHICCQTLSGQYDVSAARARAVYTFLIQNGVNRKRLSYKGYGNTRPIYPIPEKNAQEEEENRRVEIVIVEN
jgi:outer membrane protein OmpA-like peptidoglycan-associated protein